MVSCLIKDNTDLSVVTLNVDIGGRPGRDCRGFCEYCYFRRVKEPEPLGCRYCPPWKKGCDYCSRSVREWYEDFKPLRDVADRVLADLGGMREDPTRITVSGGGDPSCYPWFADLMELLSKTEIPLHIGYTSGKGFDDPDTGNKLVGWGLSEISYTVFSADPHLRSRYMHDPTPGVSLSTFETLAERIDAYAAAVVLKGINDGDELIRTCQWLEDAGARGLILMRFANEPSQGLILGDSHILPGQPVMSVSSFRDLVEDLNGMFRMKISGTPLYDPDIGSPFAIRRDPYLLSRLPKAERKATIITGSVAAPFIREILGKRGFSGEVVGVEKEIACLITAGDLKELDLAECGETVIIPGRAFVHDQEAGDILSGDGKRRQVIRGPDCLTADAETSMGMRREEVLELELLGFSDLIRCINRYGNPD